MEETRITLLMGFQTDSTSKQPWNEFYKIYGPVILAYGRKLGLKHDQAEDVLQETMMALMRILRDFTYDPAKGKFRNFLLTIVHRKALAAIRRAQKKDPISMAPNDVALESAVSKASDQSMSAATPLPAEEREDIWQESLMEQAMNMLMQDPKIQKQTLDIFLDYVVNDLPPAEVAEKYDIKENAVYQIKNRLVKQLRKIAGDLMEGYAEE